jgi:hypothetical protein
MYNMYLSEEYQVDQMFDESEDPLRNFLHSATPGDPATFARFFTDLAAHSSRIDADMREWSAEPWPADLVFDSACSEVDSVLGKRARAKEDAEEEKESGSE